MAGLLKIYSDAGFTAEFPVNTGAYAIDFGIMNGTSGQVKTIPLYCKNVGDQTLQSRSISESSDPETLQSYSIDNVTFTPSTLVLADLAAGATQIVYVKVTVPVGTSNVGNPRLIAFTFNALSI